MDKKEIAAQMIETWKAIKSMENNVTCWEMGDVDTYERLEQRYKELTAKYEQI